MADPTDRFVWWTYIGLFIAWNVSLATAMAYLWTYRHSPLMRMRKLPLLFVGIISLHVYGAFCLLLYPVKGILSCTSEFWLMSIYLPLGIALFQAANTQFLNLASRQKKFANMSTLRDHKPISMEKAQQLSGSRWKRTVFTIKQANHVGRTLIFIGVGLCLQFVITLVVFLGSKKFHASWGLFNYTVKGTGKMVRLNCSKGWEWWLSIVWQISWTWIYAPYVLWMSRNIRDVHGWRLQTICCCLAGIPASPLWLAGLYIEQFAPLDKYFPPPTWFSLCIFLIEISAIGFPIMDIRKGNNLKQKTLEAIATWELRIEASGGAPIVDDMIKNSSVSSISTDSKPVEQLSHKASFESNNSVLLTMTALENALRVDPLPLLEFAALRSFSGETVSFLTHVMDWRCDWLSRTANTANHNRNQFLGATRIYSHFVSLEFSEFPINISSQQMKVLHNIFEKAAVALHEGKPSRASSISDVTPFAKHDGLLLSPIIPAYDYYQTPPSPTEVRSIFSCDFENKQRSSFHISGQANLEAVSRLDDIDLDESLAGIEIPEEFNEMVFEEAEEEIKYLVLTNTWPLFVTEGRAQSRMSHSTDEETGEKWFTKMLCLLKK